jgi:hypothetical protein
MNSFLWALLVFAAVGIGVWLVSFVIEALRPKPKAPAKLRWAPKIPVETVEVGGNRLRYIKSGKGPALVRIRCGYYPAYTRRVTSSGHRPAGC